MEDKRIVVQLSVDIEMDEGDCFDEKALEKALFSYWYAEKHPNIEVVGSAWKATWNAEDYHNGKPPVSSD